MLITRQNNPLANAAVSGIDLYELAHLEAERRKKEQESVCKDDGRWTLEDFQRAHEYSPRSLK